MPCTRYTKITVASPTTEAPPVFRGEVRGRPPHAPRRPVVLSAADRELALQNVLRYFPESTHAALLPELAEELDTLGLIYVHRLRPTGYVMRAHPLEAYPAKCRHVRS